LRSGAGHQWPALKPAQQDKLDTLMRAAMAESPELRTRGAEGLADELREWLGLSPPRSAMAPTEPAATKPAAWWKRWLWLGAAAGLGLLATAARIADTAEPTASAQSQPHS
ncbi:MAG TPA: hypothetical protein VGF12_01780, partial [Roseateles sp.]|uniref:hypothetical protein n=1 Tax=Roseateles sp. TaxID=1971397 RepID=UPI002ED7C12E